MAEHHFSDYGTLGGPAVFLSALAARTQKLRLGAAISVLPFHDPIRIAEVEPPSAIVIRQLVGLREESDEAYEAAEMMRDLPAGDGGREGAFPP